MTASLPKLNQRTTGRGPLVVCLHSSGSSSAQWQALIERLAPRYQVIAVDLLGHGASEAPAPGSPYSLRDESAALQRLLHGQSQRVHLVGHSYGGAVALDYAARNPAGVRALSVFEPVLFGLLDRDSAALAEATGIGDAVVAAVASGEHEWAARRFIDYWGGAGSWDRMSPRHREAQLRRITTVARHFQALLADPVPAAAVRRLVAPVLLLGGERSPHAAQAVAAELASLLPLSAWAQIGGAGHLAPITDADSVNSLIAEHIDANAPALDWREAA